MKIFIKIALLVLVAGGIAAAIYFFTKKGPDTGQVDELSLTPFEEYIEQRVSNEIEEKDFTPATQAYNSIRDEIATEAFATRSDGSRTLSRSAERRCRRNAFSAYAPIFTDHASSYFRRSEWQENYVDSLRTMARGMLSDTALHIGSNLSQKLNAIVTTVNDYHEAWRTARSANQCTTIEAAREVARKANSFRRDPLNNNTALMAALRDAPTQAKNSLSNYIVGRCNHLAANYRTYSSYEDFTQEYRRVSNLVTAFKNEYGQNSLAQASSTLRTADTNAMDYFMGRNGNNGNGNAGNGNRGNNRGYRLETDGQQNNRSGSGNNRGNNRQERREY